MRHRSVACAGALAIVLLGALGPSVLGAAAAAAAGTLLEAAPFVLLAAFGGRLRFASLLGCGCPNCPLPGALALPALALCWLSFGPAATLGRATLALALAARRRRGRIPAAPPAHAPVASAPGDPLGELATLGASAFAAALAAAALTRAGPLPGPVAFVAGLLTGMLAPCATAGVALAAGFAHAAPLASAGILATAGLVTAPALRAHRAPPPRPCPPRAPALAAYGLLALALGCAAAFGAPGLVNPRLRPVLALGAPLALAVGAERTARRRARLLPLGLLAALVVRAPAPPGRADATDLAGAYAGERLAFAGTAHRRGDASVLERYAITCCRLDATALVVRLDRRVPVPEGTWLEANGTLATAHGGLVLHAARIRPIAPPPDPFLYR